MTTDKKKKVLTVYRRFALILFVLLGIFTCFVGGTYAYLKWVGGTVANTFTADQSVMPTIKETFNNKEKKDVFVSVGNNSDSNDSVGYSVYVRASIVATWATADGNSVYSKMPVAGTDYTLELNLRGSDTNTGWFLGNDGYYYYNTPVVSAGNTDVLIKSCKPIVDAPVAGYTLHVKVITQTVQAAGTTDVSGDLSAVGVPAVTDAWGVNVSQDGTLTN